MMTGGMKSDIPTSIERPARLVARNLPYSQSQNVFRVHMPKMRQNLHGIRLLDWFHVLLRLPTYQSFGALLGSWTFCILIFAIVYQGLDNSAYQGQNCGLSGTSGNHFGVYFAFSLETCTTVGYGLPGSTNAFFENCPGVQVAIFSQMVWSMIFNALFLAFLFARVAKSEDRGFQVIFSNQAILKRVGSSWWFSFRVADVDPAFPVVESHVRIYAKRGHTLTPLRVSDPNDDLGAVLSLSWPQVISHEVDSYSPLLKSPIRHQFQIPTSSNLLLREADGVTGNRDEYECPICGETYGTLERLKKHVQFSQLVERKDEYPIEGSHQTLDLEQDFCTPATPSLQQMMDEFPDEVIVLIEGIDPLASGTFQALQSYTRDEISWKGDFAVCTTFEAKKTAVDLTKFHQIQHQRPSVVDETALEHEHHEPTQVLTQSVDDDTTDLESHGKQIVMQV